jgi:endonuclease/exonuclease/phosphatase family metal-dependent hydrolase
MVVALWLLLCLAASYVSPVKAKYLALFSITTPFAIAANALFCLFWLIGRRRRRIVLSLAVLGICYKLVLAVIGWHIFPSKETATATRGHLKIMTWNVHGMGIFDRPMNRETDDAIMDFIQKESPDILCMPEFYTVYNNALKPYSTEILKRCGYKEFRFKDDNSLGTKIYLGTAIFSKYPIRAFKDEPLHKYVYLLQCDVHLPSNQIVRTYFVHLQSFLLSNGEKTYLEEVKHRNSEIGINQSKSFVHRFGEAYVKRAIQADSAAGIIARSPYPVIICGDFNDLPGSYTYTRMKGKLADAFTKKGKGLGRTYNLFSPTLRIDYIFYDPAFLSIKSYRSPHTRLSDHNPVIVDFELPAASEAASR